jgi:type I restriction enzyme S subunit
LWEEVLLDAQRKTLKPYYRLPNRPSLANMRPNRSIYKGKNYLPSVLEEQRRIVVRIKELAGKIEEARSLRQQALDESGVVLAHTIQLMFTSGAEHGWSSSNLGDFVADDCYGTSERASDDQTGTPVLRMGNIQAGRLDLRDLKYLHLTVRDREKLLLRKGDILVNRTNSAELVGKCAVFNTEGDFAFASYLIRLRLRLDRAEPRLVAAYINSPIGRSYMFSERKQMTGQANVNATKLKALPIHLPPLTEQRRIVAYLDDLQAKVDALKKLQSETAAELDALLPSILDRAFAGAL